MVLKRFFFYIIFLDYLREKEMAPRIQKSILNSSMTST